jgi:GT2 family glycosyltransferase
LVEVSVAIPTYRREGVLLETLNQLLALKHRACEILVVDQTPEHEFSTISALEKLEEDGSIIWHRLQIPSIPKAMNHALLTARHEVVLFLDDDVELTSELVREHAKEHDGPNVTCVAGGVVQLWHRKLDESEDAWLNGRTDDPDAFRFNSGKRRNVRRFSGGNFSVKKKAALGIGGFDENFVKAAYRYEAEFAERLLGAGYVIQFQPAASLVHLKVSTGGTRSFGNHLKSIKPAHSVGRYYYLIAAKRLPRRFRRIILGPFEAIRTKHHLSRPWWIPVTLCSEFSGMMWAWWLFMRGQKHVDIRRSC